MMKQLNMRVVALIFILASLLMAGQVLYYRLQMEEQAQNVAIAMEYGDLLKVAEMSGRQPLELLAEAQDLGLNALVLLDDQALKPDLALMEYARLTGLRLAAQLNNENHRQDNAVVTMAYLTALPNLDLIFFAGYEALGWPDQVEAVAEAYAYLGLPPGYVEMLGVQEGLDRIMEKMHYRMIRIHPGYAYETLEDMVRSVKERGIRFLFLKPFKNMGLVDPDPPVNQVAAPFNAAFLNAPITLAISGVDGSAPQGEESADQVLLLWVGTMAQQISEAGFPLGEVQPLEAWGLAPVGEVYLCAGIIVACLWLAAEVLAGLKYRALLLSLLSLLFIACLGYFLLGYGEMTLFRDTFALLAAIAFPSLGSVRAALRHREEVQASLWLFGLRVLLESSLFTLLGAMITNALLSETIYLTAWHTFRGVKLALLAPVLLVLVTLVIKQLGQGFDLSALRGIKPLRLVLALAGFLIGGIYLLRSGNEVSSISAPEQMLRLNLESFFGVRPRFKEFLLGHPAAMLLGWPKVWRWPELRVGLLLFAAMAQASLFNTFMHLHTPLLLSMQRTLWGLALGEVIGMLLLLLLYAFRKRQLTPS